MQYAVQSQVRWHGYDPESAIVFAKPEKVTLILCEVCLTAVYIVWRNLER